MFDTRETPGIYKGRDKLGGVWYMGADGHTSYRCCKWDHPYDAPMCALGAALLATGSIR